MGQAKKRWLRNVSLDDKYALDRTRAYMTGIEALVRLPMLQHQRDQLNGLNTAGFISGYRGSPLGGVDQAMQRAAPFLDRHNIHFQPGLNEDLAATSVWGSQQTDLFDGARYDGVFAMWYGKGPGVDRSMDAIKHANAFGTSRHGGVLAVAGDDHACKSSTLPHQSEHQFIGASIPVLAPANVQEVLDLGVFGWELSRFSGCWVALKAITENMDSAISADIDPERVRITLPSGFDLPADGVHARWPDRPLDQERRLNRHKIYAAREFARVNGLNRVVIDSEQPRLGIITSGKAYLDVMQALEDIGIDEASAQEIGLRVFKVGMPWPLEPQSTHDFADGLEEILVVEEKRSIIEDQLTSQLYNYPVGSRPRVIGEFNEHGEELLPNTGELTPAMIAIAIASRLRRFFDSPTLAARVAWIEQKEQSLARAGQTLQRTPHFCSGCPHNTSTKVPEGSHAMGGIGCHYMATWMSDRPTLTFTQMGGEGATWIGQAPFTDRKHVFQNLGDGTYFHSGLLAIRAAVAAGVNITYKILYNEAVAMTGGQALDGALSIEALVQQLAAEGIKRIALITEEPTRYQTLRNAGLGRDGVRCELSVDGRERLDAIQRELRDTEGTTAIIYQQPCATEQRRRRKKGEQAAITKRVIINDAVCEGCGDCGAQSNCLSIKPKATALGTKRTIDQSSCNADYSCLTGFCPSFITVDGELHKPVNEDSSAPPKKSSRSSFDTDMAAIAALPEPTLPALDQPWNGVVAGVGGSGVLTVASLIAMAAHIEGKGCATLNQTGLAQKFGAVTSHVRIATRQEAIKAVRIPAGEADLLIGCDLVVSAEDDCLAKVAKNRTSALINTTEQPTAAFLHDPDAQFPATALRDRITQEMNSEQCAFLDASALALKLLGDTVGANLMLLGVAWQRGQIPVSREALERAIELNGVAVDFNQRAFALGRQFAHDSLPFNALLASTTSDISTADNAAARTTELTLAEIIADRLTRLTRYANQSYADRYLERVSRIQQHDRDKTQRLTRHVAEQLFRLMAIKDEYEVARLHSDPEFLRQLSSQFEPGFRLQYHLAPPLLSKTDPNSGRPVKTTFGSWLLPVFKVLARLRFLRGTVFDLFAYSAERRRERADLAQYECLLDMLIEEAQTEGSWATDSERYQLALALTALPATLRGFGPVRDKNRERYNAELGLLLLRWRGGLLATDASGGAC